MGISVKHTMTMSMRSSWFGKHLCNEEFALDDRVKGCHLDDHRRPVFMLDRLRRATRWHAFFLQNHMKIIFCYMFVLVPRVMVLVMSYEDVCRYGCWAQTVFARASLSFSYFTAEYTRSWSKPTSLVTLSSSKYIDTIFFEP